MKVAVVGYGKQGHSAYEYWSKLGNEITICDQDESLDLPKDAHKQLGKFHLQRLDRFDLIIRSPIVHPRDLVAANSPDILSKVTTVTNEFIKVCPSRNIIGVTGTKGKGTTSTLIAKMLEVDGRRVHLGGNIGTPPLDLLKDNIGNNDWVVLELANFQLIDLKISPHIAVCLMIAPEHLDWHADSEEYYTAKTQLFRYQTSDDIAIYYAKNEISKRIASTGKGWKIPYMAFPGSMVVDGQIVVDNQTIASTSELKLLGEHNWQNVCAAVTVMWKVSQNFDAIRKVLTSFTGLPYRLELRREVNGVRYYNDSFASAPSASIAAIKSIPGKKVMIIGGFDRGLDLDNFAKDLLVKQSEIRSVLLVGASAQRTADALTKSGFTNYKMSSAKDMSAITKEAVDLAQEGDAVVLSPGFSSFDMFKNFEVRGQKFNEAVEAL
jgi:UDP-N-acetylmuramoylalanine--D-glutamate ligase